MPLPGTTIGYQFTHSSLTLDKRVDVADLDEFRKLNDNTGDTKKVVYADGSWIVVDQSGTGNSLTVTPPKSVTPTFIKDKYFIKSYRENQLAERGLFDVKITLEREEPRDPEDTSDVLSQTRSTGQWKFDFAHGTIATRNVTADTQSDNDKVSVDMTLEPEQAEVIMEAPTYLEAVSIETVPDGDDFVRDNNSNNRNTVDVTSPSNIHSNFFTDGKYAVERWTLEPTPEPTYDVSMDIWQL